MDKSTELLVMFQQLGNHVFIPLLLSSIRPFALTRVSEMTRKMLFFTTTKINRVQVMMKLGLVAWLLCNFDKWFQELLIFSIFHHDYQHLYCF